MPKKTSELANDEYNFPEKQRHLAPQQAAAVQPLLPQQAIVGRHDSTCPGELCFFVSDQRSRLSSNRVAWAAQIPLTCPFFFCKLFCHSSLMFDPESGPRFWLLHSRLQATCLREVLPNLPRQHISKACALSNSWWTTWKKQQLRSCRPPCLVTNEEAKFRISSSLKKQENLKKSNHAIVNRAR